ncbi:2-C-methyl-D-erythritol 4-phosphate cytidylyltransferase [Chitinimonas arctica]|uniref:2-C-methyl-D-erythritol 4-phosphate cytidylyltransferase n=1 Tax=Chitinimonas arctica TaxID=2594795 RepID=A0A516SDE4_9NEIS|nr:2-C-methyl-D-erythritol 4-phosphate cytidylyltransferase [Chitinimonas arctica]QDQ26185.1 2-C-methyl-D-erythritol 4-phosphate cytidylyltransferase [Chitinimonas arctica]
MNRFVALLPAAGSGSRMGAATPKQYLPLLGQPLLVHTLRALLGCPGLERVVLVLSPDDAWFEPAWVAGMDKLTVLRCGGASRAETVRNGLAALQASVAADDWILVHDAARPCIGVEEVERLIDTLRDDPVGGLLALPLADTLKRADGEGRSLATVPRDTLWRAQTPQMFRHGMLLRALESATHAGITDEASAIEALGLAPRLVAGNERNIKVTYPDDLALASLYLAERNRV